MIERAVEPPGSDHPIAIEPYGGTRHRFPRRRVIADTRAALVLREAAYPSVVYVSRRDADMTLLARSERRTYCPYKGDCVYYDIVAGGMRATDAVWSYEAPYAAIATIKDHLAFYPDVVEIVASPPTA